VTMAVAAAARLPGPGTVPPGTGQVLRYRHPRWKLLTPEGA
jgi:hypothetical protein